ncbi:hypothetical protein BT93_G1191 [Corymbia citriodora subsp. variegata]|nr:hypothetical protein BT93_G1191 [Corymbia citriodora subsp. variegata]
MVLVGTTQVPVIVFSEECMKPGKSSWAKACEVIVQALEDNGCFILDHPNVPLGLHDSIFSVAEDLFDVPHESKIKNINLKPVLGYTGQIPATSVVEALTIVGPEKLEECEKFTSLMWPSGNDRFCKAAHDYGKFIAEIEEVLFRMVCQSYGVEKCYDPYIDSTSYLLRFLKSRRPEGVEAWSNGRIKACDYQVVVTEENQVGYSLATFSYVMGMIEMPEEFIDEAYPRQYKPFIHMDFLCFYDSTDDCMKGESLIGSFCRVRPNNLHDSFRMDILYALHVK